MTEQELKHRLSVCSVFHQLTRLSMRAKTFQDIVQPACELFTSSDLYSAALIMLRGQEVKSWSIAGFSFSKGLEPTQKVDSEHLDKWISEIIPVEVWEGEAFFKDCPLNEADSVNFSFGAPIRFDGSTIGALLLAPNFELRAECTPLLYEAANDLAHSYGEHRFHELIESVSDWLWEVDAKGRYTYVSSSVKKLLGYSPEEILGKTPFDLMTNSEAESVEQIYNELSAARKPIVRLLNRTIHRDGHEVVLETSGLPVIIDGVFKGYRGIDRDVTKRVRLERDRQRLTSELRHTASLLESVLNAIPDMIGILDTNRKVVRYNAAGYKYLGIKPEDAIGQRCHELIGRDEPCEECPTELAIETKTANQVVRKSTITNKWFDIRSYPMIDDLGKVLYVIEHIRDITEQKQQEEMLLHRQKLESLGVMAGGIAHDFNNLLTSIMGNADLAELELVKDSPACYSINELKVAARRAAGLCSQLLAYAGKARFVIEEIDLRLLVGEMEDLLKASMSKKVNLTRDFPEELPKIRVDTTQIRQIAMNLVINAAEACAVSGGDVNISIGCEQRTVASFGDAYASDNLIDGEYVYLRVADTGCGMAEENRKHLFEPFFSTKTIGRGLGLSAVLGIVKSHNGAITFESRLDEGTVFTVYLPVKRTTRALGQLKPRPASSVDSHKGLAGKTILLVDDEKMVRKVAEAMLKKMKMAVLAADDGESAIAIYEEKCKEIDGVILDLSMPGLDGFETLRAIRRINKNAVVILSSGYTIEEADSICQELQPNGIVSKPMEFKRLKEELSQLLND